MNVDLTVVDSKPIIDYFTNSKPSCPIEIDGLVITSTNTELAAKVLTVNEQGYLQVSLNEYNGEPIDFSVNVSSD
jgi:hypothetical protein